MTSEEYITKHWIPNKIWTHLTWQNHQTRLKRCAGFLEGARFADVGCACGHSTNIMSGFKEGEWTGIDFSATGIKMAKEQFPELAFRLCRSIKQLGALKPFDSVVCSELIEHVPDDKVLLVSLLRITNHQLVITTPNLAVDDPGHQRCYNEASLKELLDGLTYRIYSEGAFYFINITK